MNSISSDKIPDKNPDANVGRPLDRVDGRLKVTGAARFAVEYPIDRKIGFSSAAAFAKASSPHGYQSTGLAACCSKYGLRSRLKRFIGS